MKHKLLITFLGVGFTLATFYIYDNLKAEENIIETLSEKKKNEYKTREEISTNIDDEEFLNNFYKDIEDKDIRKLSIYYTTKEAIDDKCLIKGIMYYNKNKLEEFKNKYSGKKDTFLRVISYNDEGDMIINDLKYVANDNKIYVVTDYTRDIYSEKVIKTNTYNNINQVTNILE